MIKNKLLILFITVGCLFLLPAPNSCQPFNYTIYREADGLPSGYVEQAYEDSRGYLWLCTFGGLSRFDGRNFKNYDIKDGLADNFCDNICEDKNGNFWIGTRKGLSYFNGNTFTNYYNPDSLEGTYFSNGYVDEKNHYHCLLNYKNAVVLNSRIQYTNILDAYTSLPKAKVLLKTFRSGLQVINTKDGLYLINKNQSIVKIEPADNYNTFTYFVPGQEDAFYFANKKGLYQWRHGVVNKLSQLDFSNNRIITLFVDNQKKIWISCENVGVYIIEGNNTTLIYKELPGLLVPNLFQDNNGVMWVSTFRGLVKLTPNNVEHFSSAQGLINEDIRSSEILRDSSVRMQTSVFKNGKLSPLSKTVSLLDTNFFKDYITSMQLDFKNRWWVFAGRNIYVYDHNKATKLNEQIGYSTSNNSIFCTNDSSLWFGFGNEVRVIKNDTIFKKIHTLSNGTHLKQIHSFYQDEKGNIWIAERERLLLLNNNGFQDFTNQLQLPRKVLAQVSCSNSKGFWVRTQGFGALHFSYNGNGFVKDKSINTDNGLPNNFIHDIETDDDENIWIATLNGLYRAHENLNKNNTFNIRGFTKADGIDVPNWNLAYLEHDHQQNIWLGVANGVFRLNSKKIVESYRKPNIFIEKIEVLNSGNGKTNLINNQQEQTAKVQFTSLQNDIAFYFDGVNTFDSHIEYSYMLQNKDVSWITHQKSDKAIYYNLPPGKYTFMVKAVNNAGIESSIASYSFTIVPPFYQTWWFRILIALCTIFLIITLIKRRDFQREKENETALQMSELKLTALQSQMNPHFIFNSLNSIQNYIMQQKPVDAARYLSKFSKLMRRILDQSFKNLTPLNEIIETLKMYMELEAFRFSNEFTWHVKVDDLNAIQDVKLPPLLLQPYVENAIIHGLMPKEGNKTLEIHLYVTESELHCVIDDNGVGRGNKLDSSTDHISHGQKLTTDMLVTMKQLLHTDAKIFITDKKDIENNPAGTKVELIIPLT